MPEGPDITRIAALIGDPSRAAILSALMGGKALTAGELADEAGVSPATTSGHLAQLLDADLIAQRKQGRHRYFVLRDPETAEMLEGIASLAAAKGHLRTRPGPRDPALRHARVCYDHLAGARGVQLFDSLTERAFLKLDDTGTVSVADSGLEFLGSMGIDHRGLTELRRPLCRTCLDWSERRSHLSGALGAAFLTHMLDKGWLKRLGNSRAIRLTSQGAEEFDACFPKTVGVL